MPPLRPLALVVKALLRDRGMGEVFTGGLGSYAVTNMVLAHLQAEGCVVSLTSDPLPQNTTWPLPCNSTSLKAVHGCT